MPRRSLLDECHMMSQYTCTCDFVYLYNNIKASPAPIFKKITHALTVLCVDLLYLISSRNWTVKVKSWGRNSFMFPVGNGFYCTALHETPGNSVYFHEYFLCRMLSKSEDRSRKQSKISCWPLHRLQLSLH